MILLNFTRKMDSISLELFHQMTGLKISEQVMLPLESNSINGFISELDKAFQKVKLTDEELSSDRVVVNPSNNQNTMCALIAILKKKTGQMPYLMVTRPSAFGLSSRVELQEVIDLQELAQ